MSLNPIAFGEHVVEQFQRYLLTYFPIADRGLEQQVREHLSEGPGGRRELVRGPYIHLNRPFEPGPMLDDLVAELDLHPVLPGLFRFDQLYKHQELATRAILDGKHTVMATATGSGKTEGFLLPILDHCLRLRDEGTEPGVTAVLVYPMNALVNDQLDRLRRMLAGTQITFGRYTGETPPSTPDNLRHLAQSRSYTEAELRAQREEHADLPRPWEEAVSRSEIRQRTPRLLLTNYRMLEYLLLRDRDLRELLQGAPLKYMVFDEVHTYTGTLGSEVACLIRRLRHVSGRSPDEVTCIGTSATVRPEEGQDADELTRQFAHRLFGVPAEYVELVGEQHLQVEGPPADSYTPPRPDDARLVLQSVLDTARAVHLQEEVSEVPVALLEAAEELCGRSAPAEGSVNDRLHALLSRNEIVQHLSRRLTRPLTLEDLHSRLRQIGDRDEADEDELTCEAMAYLTLGAICQEDDEPLLRPKLHYFIQGYPGLWLSFEPEDPDASADSPIRPRAHFSGEQPEGDGDVGVRLPMMLCRACGQHYARAIAQEAWAAGDDNAVMPVRPADPWEHPGEDETVCYLTDRLHTQEEDTDAETWFMCRWCGALHRRQAGSCQHEKCGRTGPLVPLLVWREDLSEKNCKACGSRGTISGTRSAEVADVNTLSESMLSAMDEPTLRKLLVFGDNRQEAAFQAGWMRERSRRHELRHLLYTTIHDADEPLSLDALVNRLVDRAEEHRVLDVGHTEEELAKAQMRARWFLLQEFASMRERRGSLEALGLARIDYEGLAEDADAEFFGGWAEVFGMEPADVVDLTRTLLDYYRRRGIVSDDLMQHWWQWRDPEVRDGLISVGDWW